MRTISGAGLTIIKQFEGLKLSPYLDSVKVPTIGYGSTFYEDGTKVTMKDPPINEARASAILDHVANAFGEGICKIMGEKVNTLTSNQFDAILCFSYNLGLSNLKSSTLLKKIMADPNDETIKAEFLKWNKAGGKVLNGLTLRRTSEALLYFKK